MALIPTATFVVIKSSSFVEKQSLVLGSIPNIWTDEFFITLSEEEFWAFHNWTKSPIKRDPAKDHHGFQTPYANLRPLGLPG